MLSWLPFWRKVTRGFRADRAVASRTGRERARLSYFRYTAVDILEDRRLIEVLHFWHAARLDPQ